MNNYIWLKIIFLVGLALFFPNFASAQTVSFSPTSIQVARSSNFSFVVTVGSVSNLFGVAFDLDFNPSLIDFVSATEGTFLSSGCQTSLMTAENPPGKLIFGLTRLGASCGGVSGSGTLATLNFRSLSQDGSSVLSFFNNSLCLLSGSKCNYITGTWTASTVTVSPVADTTPPAAPTGVTVF